jgi:hypothetical protein
MWSTVIRHSFNFPPGQTHTTQTQRIGWSGRPTQRTESNGDSCLSSNTDSQVIQQIARQRPSIHQTPPFWSIRCSRRLKEPTPPWTKGTRPKPQMARTMTLHGKEDGSIKLKASITTSREDGPCRAGTMCHTLETNHSPIYMFSYVVRPNWDAAALLSNRRKSVTL